jgi:hypothetical protein
MLTSGGDAGTQPESGVDSDNGRIRGGRILRRRRGSGGLQARMSHGKGRGHDGRVERLTGGELHDSDRNFRRRRKAMAAGSGKHGGGASGQDEAGHGAAGRGALAGARALAFIGAGRPRHARTARLPMAAAAWPQAVRLRWAQMGFGGSAARPAGRVGPSGLAQSGRIGFLFFEFIFNVKTNSRKV